MLQAAQRSGYHALLSYQPSTPGFDARLGSKCVTQYAGTGKEIQGNTRTGRKYTDKYTKSSDKISSNHHHIQFFICSCAHQHQ